MDDKSKIDAICSERTNLRQEIIGFEHSSAQATFAFLALVGVFAGIYWKPEFINDSSNRAIILILISQVQFFLALFVLTLHGCVQAQISYIAALEEKINKLCGDTVNIWESRVSRNYIIHQRAPFLWGIILQTFLMIVLFVTALILALREVSRVLAFAAIMVELAVVLTFLIAGVVQGRLCYRFARAQLGLLTEQQPTEAQAAQQPVAPPLADSERLKAGDS